MSITLPIIEAIFSTGQTLYAVITNRLNGQVWTGSAFENYNSAHWSSYAIALTEQTPSGYYMVARPSGVSGYLTSERIYQQAGGSPADTDTAINLVHSQGENVAAISGDPSASPSNLQAALSTETQGTIQAGSITAQSFTTNLVNTNAGAFQGLTIRFITGVCAGMAGLIANYTVSGGVIALSGSLAATPSAGDTFVIV